ncbi:uncharacterized protein LOC121378728 [Gigantopelta aegis]|uniref:uncharacterized protein LOC121378728 n=1 Tax=Gigantopelta aegis TaxID=1735272 RepID=UPI001B888F1D|nr:uncharacterized protein LOC121378728 [Gigantopelta aegis]
MGLSVLIIVELSAEFRGTRTRNVARGMPAIASSSNFQNNPEKAIDGNTTSSSSKCFITNILKKFVIEVFSHNPGKCPGAVAEICLNYTADPLGEGQTTTLTCDKPARGRFLRIREWFAKWKQMPLCEVEVYPAVENGCDYPKSFPRVESTRLLSQQSELLNDTTLTECAVKCGTKITCLAFNVNVNTLQCELVCHPSFNDSKQSDPHWDYYGSDLCYTDERVENCSGC